MVTNAMSAATLRGREARLLGIPVEACPYPHTDRAALLWVTGWVREDVHMGESIISLVRQTQRESVA